MRTILLIISIVTCIFLIGYGNVNAMVSGPCANCHTMHYSQNGTELPAWGSAGPYNTLLINDCLGCHSSSTDSTYYEIDGVKYPVVLYTGGAAPDPYLAGGNFWWVKEGLGGDDTKGHNVFLGEPDDNLNTAPGNQVGCGAPGSTACHHNISDTLGGGYTFDNSRQGCTKCHMIGNLSAPKGYHHLDDTGPLIDSADEGWYRFLAGHLGGDGHGVTGIEDTDWQATSNASDHNEYLGFSGEKDAPKIGFGSAGVGADTMTAFCTGCHALFHWQDLTEVGSSPWLRHPSDAVIPDRDEYADAYGVGHAYDPQVPVARADLSGGVSSTVTIGVDMVMCLSCHRPHGSPYPDMLRWDYDTMNAGGGGSGGCFTCHTQKN